MEFLDFIWLKTKCQREKDKEMLLKVRKFQNEIMKSSHCPKYEWKDLKNSALSIKGKIFKIFGNATASYFHPEISFPLKSRGPILRVKSRSVCVKQALNTPRWLVNALVT